MLLTKVSDLFKQKCSEMIVSSKNSGSDLSSDEKDNINVTNYRLTKALYGRKHPDIETFIDNNYKNIINEKGYCNWTERNRLYKYFQILDKNQLGFEVFLKLFQKNQSYSNLGINNSFI
jgi:hypothetical protein